MGTRHRPRARRRATRDRARAFGRGSPYPWRARGPRELSALLIREGPATELTVATRILAHLGVLTSSGRVATLVGGEVVYVAGRGASAATMTPYDIAAVRLLDGTDLAGAPPPDIERYLEALRGDRSARAVALVAPGEVATAPDLLGLVEGLAGTTWSQAEARAKAAGALFGAYPAEV